MTKKIPGSSLPLVVISLHILFLPIALFALYNLYALDTATLFSILPNPAPISLMATLILTVCLPFPVILADFLYLKRDRPRSTKRVLVIISLILFSLLALFVALNLMIYLLS